MSSLFFTNNLQFYLNNILASIAFFFLLVLFKQWKKPKDQKLPPGPWKLPLIGSLHHLVGKSDLLHNLRSLATKYGPLMHLQFGQVSTVMVSSPQTAKQILQTHDLVFSDRPETLAADIMWYNKKDIVFCPYGDYWAQMRKICVVELLSPKRVRSFGHIRQDEASRLVESISSTCGEPINLTKKLSLSVSLVTCRATFGTVCQNQETMVMLFREGNSKAGGFDVADLYPSLRILQILSGRKRKLLKMHQEIDKVLDDIIERKKAHSAESGDEEEDLLDVLLRLKESGSLQIPIDNFHIKAVISDIFAAGTETSSITIEMVMAELIRNPRVMAKVQAEIRQTYKRKGSIDESDVQGLQYFKLVIKEALRLHPPVVMMPRICKEDREINGFFIPAGTRVMLNFWAIGRHPDHWHDPDSFVPERFQQSSINFNGNHFEYIPFGAGRRICPGISFGLASTELLLAKLFFHFNWKLPGGMNPRELDMTRASGISAGRKEDLYLIATPFDPSLHG